MKNTLISLLAVTLVACGGGGAGSSSSPTPPVPVAGTLLSSECDGYTLVEKFADGQGGSTEEVTPRAPSCGWDPTPYGELSETFCEEPYTLVSVYHDGEYGFYEEREEDVEQCGYIAPVLDVTIDNTYGDRFRPVVVTVNNTVQGEPAEWTYEIEMGRAVKIDDNTLHIFGDGQSESVDLILYINDEAYTYRLKREPRCEKMDGGLDCQGYTYNGPKDGYIYYGEDDTDIVYWDLMYTVYDRTVPSGEYQPAVEGDELWEEAVEAVNDYNLQYERSGVFIRYRLAVVGRAWWDGNGGHTSVANRYGDYADVAIGKGPTCTNACGCAQVNRFFREYSGYTVAGTSRCGLTTDLHEIGHMVGLAHGPNNLTNEANGYIWPDFGHGWREPFCAGKPDVMSYDGGRYPHNNSRQTCSDYADWTFIREGSEDDPAGDRSYADSAYHLNRVRYDVSLISKDPDVLTPRSLEAEPEMGELVICREEHVSP